VALDWNQISARRLERAGLASPHDGTLADVVAAMCGAHAQVNSAAELSIALRLGGGVTRADVREDRALVKTFGPRGTVHLLPGRDLPWWTAALSAVPRASNPMPEPARMTDQQTERVVAAIGDALLAAGRELTVDELSEQVIARTGTWAGDLVMPAFQRMWPRWRQAISLAGRRGVLCFGRSQRGRKVTYTHPRRLFPGFQPSESEEGALTELVRRYLYAYGPATPQDFAQWLAAPKRWAAELFASVAAHGRIEEAALEWGGRAWQLAGEEIPATDPLRGVRLLPYFDAYVIACQPRERLFPGRAYERALAGGQAGNFPVVLIDGVVAGV
jgi:Winged helix DNA-binding domain